MVERYYIHVDTDKNVTMSSTRSGAYVLSVDYDALARKCEGLADLVPTNWLDPLLSGPAAVIGRHPYSGTDIEKLLRAVRDRIQAHLSQGGLERA